MTGQAVEKRSPTQQLLATIRGDDFRGQIQAALPGNILPERFVRVTATAITQTPELVTVDRATLFNAVIRCAQDGLLPDGREAALVVFNDKNAQGGKRATYLPMVAGYRKIAAKHDMSLEAFVVYERDEFDYQLGYDPSVTHKPPRLDVDRGEPIGAYAVARHRDGRRWLDVMSRGEIEKVRGVSRAATSQYGPWVNHWAEMARKTVARRLFKQLPLDDLDERDVATLEAGDADADLPREPGMTVEEADVHAGIGNGGIPADDGPDDGPVEDGEWQEAAQADPGSEAPPPGEEQTAFQIPPSARSRERGE